MKVIGSSIIYENPLPQLRSRHSFFPSVCQCADGDVMMTHWYAEQGQYKTVATRIHL